ncbi:MAG: lipopolysaccharide biosynthesis protein [Promethearchaeota archaeon]
MKKNTVKEVITKIFKPHDILSQQMISGGVLLFIGKIIELILSFLTLIIAGRILNPLAFGLVGIAYLMIDILNTFTQFGFKQALIQRKDISTYMNSAWTLSILRACILYAIMFFIAPLVSLITNEPEVKFIIQILSLSILIDSFSNIYLVYFVKELEFKKYFYFTISTTIGNFVFTVIFVIVLQNVWGIVIGKLLGEFVKVIISYLVITKNRPKFSLNWRKINELFQFGKWLLGSVILIFFITQGDDIFVGLVLGATALGLYQMAYKFSNLPATMITHAITGASYPTYSKLQDDQIKLRNYYLGILKITLFFAFPFAGLLFIISPEFITLFLGNKWLAVIPIMQILCIFGALRSINATTGPLFQAVGKPEILTKVSAIQLIFLGIIIIPMGIIYGLIGISLAVTISNFVNLYFAIREVSKIIDLKARSIILKILPFILSIIFTIFIIYIIKLIILNHFEPWLNLIISICAGSVIYLLIVKITGFSIFEYLYTFFTQDGNI